MLRSRSRLTALSLFLFFCIIRKLVCTMKALEEKILREGIVLPGHILKVGSFLNHQIDADFNMEMGREIARLFADAGITRVLTIETSGIALALSAAAALGASYVVLHMGEVELFRGHKATHTLQRMVRHGLVGTAEYARVKGELVRRRIKLAPLYLQRAKEALYALVDKAKEFNLVLGVEGRSHFEQVPGELEFPDLLAEFADCPHVRYWHDFGHIQRKHNLLLLNHDAYLRKLSPYIYGAHVNDVQWPQRDHRAPFQGGDVDFDTLLPRYFTQSMPLTWELSKSVTREQILIAKERWDALHDTLPQG